MASHFDTFGNMDIATRKHVHACGGLCPLYVHVRREREVLAKQIGEHNDEDDPPNDEPDGSTQQQSDNSSSHPHDPACTQQEGERGCRGLCRTLLCVTC